MKKTIYYNLVVAGLTITSFCFGQRVTPQLNGSKCSIQVANVYFEVDPTYGGRITSLKLDTKEILFVDNSADNWGSTFWQSPQSAWNWPPSTALNSLAYSGGIKGDSINIISAIDDTYNTKLKFRKILYADLSDTSITLKYYMINTGASSNSFAPWEITRVPVGGMDFFPDSGGITGALASQFTKIGDASWLNYTGSSSGIKCFGNSKENWTAWINSDSSVFIKKFSNVPPGTEASGESEVEYYYAGPGAYYELENQGEYSLINAGDSLKWVMKWYVRKLPKNINKTKGSVDLVNFVRKVVGIQIDTTHTSIKKSNAENRIKLSPNPARKQIYISGLDEPASITFTDIKGRIILTTAIAANQDIISIDKLTEGIYFYNVYGTGINYNGKLIIK
jgi:Secretion system C-terminal sorting domain